MEIQEIKAKLTLSEVLKYYNLKPDKNLRLHCPFHEDKTPSLQVYYKTHTAYCFSSNCKTHGKSLDVIDFVMNKENNTKHEALEKCKAMINGTTENTNNSNTFNRTQFLTNMFIYFKNGVHNSKPGQEYIKSRNLDYTKLEIGYNTGQFHHGVRKDDVLINNCIQTGLLSDAQRLGRTGNTAYKPFAKYCIVFALRDSTSQITGLYFRSTVNNEESKHFYLKDRSGIYPGYPKQDTKKLIITEAIIDAATLLQIKQINENYSIISAFGTNGLNEEIKTAVIELKQLNEIVFAFDNDEAGNKAVEKYSIELKEVFPSVILSKLILPENSDINETSQAHSEEIFTHLLNERTFIFSNEKEKVHPETQTNQLQPHIKASSLGRLEGLNTEQVSYTTNELQITLLGGISLQNLDRLRVTIYLRRNPHINAQQSIRQNIDLYQDDIVEKFIRKSAEKLDHGTTLISSAIAELTEEIEAWRLLQAANKKVAKIVKRVLTQQEQMQAKENLQREHLMQWTMETLLNTGIVGEAENAMILHTAMTSRLYEDPVLVT